MQEYIRRINYYETDKMGVTHHSNYIRFMEEARIDYLEKIGCGYENWERDGIVSPVIGIECDYRRPTTFGDELRICVRVAEYRRVKLSVAYEMYDVKSGELVFTGRSRHCFLNAEGKPVLLAREFPEYDALLTKEASL